MTKTKDEPTPGEWYADEQGDIYSVQGGAELFIGMADLPRNHVSDGPERMSNARLFAASKELLAACVNAKALLEDSESRGWTTAEDTAHTMLEFAIAKARGES